jgi:hypothetical protein
MRKVNQPYSIKQHARVLRLCKPAVYSIALVEQVVESTTSTTTTTRTHALAHLLQKYQRDMMTTMD